MKIKLEWRYLLIIIIFILSVLALFFWKQNTTQQGSVTRGPTRPSPTAAQIIEKNEEKKRLLSSENVAIFFSGKVVDENDVAVSGVEILWRVTKPGSFAANLGLPTGSTGSTLTGTDGEFKIEHIEGYSLNIISLKKAGMRR